MARATTARSPYSSGSPQAVPLSIRGTTQPGRPLRLPPLELVGTRPPQKRWLLRRNPATSEASTQNDDDYELIRVSREKMAPVGNGLAETVLYQVSQSAGRHNSAPVIPSIPLQPPARVTAVAWRCQHHFSYSCLGRAAWRMWLHGRGFGREQTAFGGPDAAFRTASCGSRCFRGC